MTIRNNNRQVYDSAQRVHPALEELRGILRYKDLTLQLIRRDLVSRYKRSVLGVAWTMLNPLGTMLIMSIVFSRVFGRVDAYPVFVLSGLIVWNFFRQTTEHCMASMLWGSSLFDRIYLPRTAFIISSIGTGLINLLISLVPLAFIMLINSVRFTPALIMLPVAILPLACFSLGLGLLLSAYAIFFPDIPEMYTILVMAWMYLSPVIVPEETLASIRGGLLLHLNPLYYLIKLFRLAVYDGAFPPAALLLTAYLIALGMLALGWLVFTKKSDQFAYYL